jgi:uncharacterized protein (TIGR04255 family)
MDQTKLQLLKAPIVEAVLDIDCDLPPAFDLPGAEARARDLFRAAYPKFRQVLMQEHTIQTKPGEAPTMSVRHAIQSLHLLEEDEKQLVQVRRQGFSFNRLAPYTSLDDYLPEIERTWRLYTQIASPTQIRCVRLRYINRILLPIVGESLQLDEYLKVGPHLPDEDRLTSIGFLNQHTAVDKATGNQVTITLATQPHDQGKLPLIFDINTVREGPAEVDNWAWLLEAVRALRALKNSVFQNTLSEQCLNLFQQP